MSPSKTHKPSLKFAVSGALVITATLTGCGPTTHEETPFVTSNPAPIKSSTQAFVPSSAN